MAGEIQTSFIPKSPMMATAKPAKSAGLGVMTVIAIILVVVSVASFGGSFLYREMLEQNILSLQDEIKRIQTEMPIDTMKEIEVVNNKLNRASTLLAGHISSTKVFILIQEMTIPTIRYTSFSFQNGAVTLSGVAKTYEDIAAQANVFDGRTEITKADFSGFSQDAKTKEITFNLAMTINPSDFAYSEQTNTATSTP